MSYFLFPYRYSPWLFLPYGSETWPLNLLLSDSKRTSTNPQLIEPPYLAHGLTGSLTGLFCFLIGLGTFFTIQLDFHRAALVPGRCFTAGEVAAPAATSPSPLQSAFFHSLSLSLCCNPSKEADLGRSQSGGGAAADGQFSFPILPCCPSAGR